MFFFNCSVVLLRAFFFQGPIFTRSKKTYFVRFNTGELIHFKILTRQPIYTSESFFEWCRAVISCVLTAFNSFRQLNRCVTTLTCIDFVCNNGRCLGIYFENDLLLKFWNFPKLNIRISYQINLYYSSGLYLTLLVTRHNILS